MSIKVAVKAGDDDTNVIPLVTGTEGVTIIKEIKESLEEMTAEIQ